MADMTPQAETTRQRGPGHEPLDFRIGLILAFTAGLVVLAIVIHLALGALMTSFATREKQLIALGTGRLNNQSGQFPAPTLQSNPSRDLNEFQAQQRAQLESYGWADRKAGIAQIPIDRAIDLVLEKGLPARPKPTAAGKEPK